MLFIVISCVLIKPVYYRILFCAVLRDTCACDVSTPQIERSALRSASVATGPYWIRGKYSRGGILLTRLPSPT